jgi:hypothetical protein
MRNRGLGTDGREGMTPTEDRIEIALQPGAPVPTGHVRVAGDDDQPFTGWLGLLTALDAATKVVAGRLDREGESLDAAKPTEG